MTDGQSEACELNPPGGPFPRPGSCHAWRERHNPPHHVQTAVEQLAIYCETRDRKYLTNASGALLAELLTSAAAHAASEPPETGRTFYSERNAEAELIFGKKVNEPPETD